VGIVIQIITDI